MSLLSALRHTVEKSEAPYTEYQEAPFDLVVDTVTLVRGLDRKEMADLFRAAFKKELYGVAADRDRWKEKAMTIDSLLAEIKLLRAELASGRAHEST